MTPIRALPSPPRLRPTIGVLRGALVKERGARNEETCASDLGGDGRNSALGHGNTSFRRTDLALTLQYAWAGWR